MNIILLAPPAAGKGTQAELLKEKFHLNHISTGDLLRNISKEESDLGKEIKAILSTGSLVSDEIVFKVLNDYLEKSENKNLLLDGFPRTINQAEMFDNLLNNIEAKVDFVFLLNVEKETLKRRITGRRLCKSCGAIYNVNEDALKPRQDSICDKCGNELYQRADDNEIAFETRYQEYLEKTKPLIDYYTKSENLYEIDSNRNKEEILNQISKIIEAR
ncbi:MAG: adenylate kinase [Firmicutes bacterium]|nr:adenylate kinase [Bacillota bacterium]